MACSADTGWRGDARRVRVTSAPTPPPVGSGRGVPAGPDVAAGPRAGERPPRGRGLTWRPRRGGEGSPGRCIAPRSGQRAPGPHTSPPRGRRGSGSNRPGDWVGGAAGPCWSGAATPPPAALRPRSGRAARGGERRRGSSLPGRPTRQERGRELQRSRPPLGAWANQRRGHKYANEVPVLPESRSQGLVGSRRGRALGQSGGCVAARGRRCPFTPPSSRSRPRADRGAWPRRR